MKTCSLKYPPIKNNIQKFFPREVVRHIKVNTFNDNNAVDCFLMGKLVKKFQSNQTATMVCKPSFINLNDNIEKSLEIEHLFANPINKGMGKRMLDFAQKYSKRIGCNGKFHLLADACYLPNKAPHLFYRKYGMSTGIKKLDKKMDKFIKNNKIGTYIDFEPTIMFYPAKNNNNRFLDFLL